MRLLLPFLLLTTAVPALAADPVTPDERAARFEQRQQAREERGERPQPRSERVAPPPQFQPVQRAERPAPPQGNFVPSERRFDGGRAVDAGGNPRWGGHRPDQPQFTPPQGVQGRPSGDSVADWRSRDRRGGGRPDATPPRPAVQIEGATYGYRDGRQYQPQPGREGWQGRDGRRDGDRRWDGRRDGDRDGRWTGRDGRYDRDGDRWRQGGVAWRPDWRRDPRYDWQRYRDRNRSIFRLGVYIDPFGWGYRPVSIGYQLYPGYYAQQYWIGDPSYYSLPPVSWPYQWVRYYNDALLIDVRDGQVVDSIPSFFW